MTRINENRSPAPRTTTSEPTGAAHSKAAAEAEDNRALAARALQLDVDMMTDPLPGARPVRRDLLNTVKDWASDKFFEKLRPDGAPEKLRGPRRVAYGPLKAPPTLKRPVVMVPGLTMPAASFDRMAERLAENPKNGPVLVYVAVEDAFRVGSVKGRRATADEVQGAKIFQVEYKDPWASPSKKAPQLDRAFSRISQAAANEGGLDVVAHSAGGTDFRLYLQKRNPEQSPALNSAVLIGPASNGTYLGNIGKAIGRPVKNVDAASRELAVGSKMIADLNQNWENQRNQLPGGVTIVGTTGTPTLGPARGIFEDGDGYMPTAQLGMPGAKTVLMEGPHNTPAAHLWQVQYSGVINAAFDVLGKG